MENVYLFLIEQTQIKPYGNGILKISTPGVVDVVVNMNNVLTVSCREDYNEFMGKQQYYVILVGVINLNFRVMTEEDQRRWYNEFQNIMLGL